MALEAVVFPQDLFIQNSRDLYSMAGGPWGYDFGVGLGVDEEERGVVVDCGGMGSTGSGGGGGGGGCHEPPERGGGLVLDGLRGSWEPSCSSLNHNFDDWDVNSSPEPCADDGVGAGLKQQLAAADSHVVSTAAAGRRKRRRTKTCKNKEEVENQRMTHIAVERNRRKQMNEYLAVLRSLMPASYVQRGDQASIIGGAINFVKELEQLLQSLDAQKRIKQRSDASAVAAGAAGSSGRSSSTPFSDFFTFPQYSTCSTSQVNTTPPAAGNEAVAENRSAIADIEVTMVESHANLKVLSRRRPKQLLKMVVGLQNLGLTTLHLNVTTIDQMVLYSFSVKVEDDCQLTSVDEIATAVYQMLGRIQEESGFD